MTRIDFEFPEMPELVKLPAIGSAESMVGATIQTPAGPALVVKQLGAILWGIYEKDLMPLTKKGQYGHKKHTNR